MDAPPYRNVAGLHIMKPCIDMIEIFSEGPADRKLLHTIVHPGATD